MNKTRLIALAIVAALIAVLTIYFSERFFVTPIENKVDTVFSTHIDTLWRDTTITEKEFVPTYIIKKKTDTLYTKDGDSIQLITESKRFDKRLVSGKDTADVEIYTTGIKTSLDSLKMRLRTHTEVVTNTIEITKYVEKKKTFFDRFHIGLQGGYGYTFKSKDLQPYVGIGVSFDL